MPCEPARDAVEMSRTAAADARPAAGSPSAASAPPIQLIVLHVSAGNSVSALAG
jgi:hypothetical protein